MQQGYGMGGSRPLTVDDIVTKTGITLGIIVLFAAANFALVPILGTGGPTMILTFVGAIGGLVTVLISTLGKKYGSAAVTIAYAVFEGLFLGGFSGIFTGFQSRALTAVSSSARQFLVPSVCLLACCTCTSPAR